MTIDIHGHFVDPHYLDELKRVMALDLEKTSDGKTLMRHNGYTLAWTRPDMFDIWHRLRDMDQKGIDRRVLTVSTPSVYPWTGPDQVRMARHVNDMLARDCRAHPDRFIGFASLPLHDVEASLAEIDRAVGELGMKGVAIGSNIGGPPLNDPRFEPLWAKIDAMRLPVFEHPMFPKDTTEMGEFELPLRVGLIFDTTLVAARLIYGGVFERYPNFPYILAHTGGALIVLLERLDNGYRLFPDCRKYITRLPSEYARRLYYDTCAFGESALMLAIGSVGASQILFGTDDPFIGADTGHVMRLPIAASDKAAILGRNAETMLGL
ncbi:MAG TPA: amidohydrolase family protein [Xanthobacteraceae bacterium]|nr:amidohydrolase family protein [Xanthobacteraceae bacterium]